MYHYVNGQKVQVTPQVVKPSGGKPSMSNGLLARIMRVILILLVLVALGYGSYLLYKKFH